MKNKIQQILILATIAFAFCVVDSVATSLYWKHLAIKHNAAFYETNSWGISTFKWNDVSYAQNPFQDQEVYAKKTEQAFSNTLKRLGIK